MPQQNMVSISISPEDLAEIKGAVDLLRSKLLPRLRPLKAEEKNELSRMGDKTLAFVRKAMEHCSVNPELAPSYLDVSEFSADMDALETLRSIYSPLLQITDSLDDTITLAGSDAYAAALVFYSSVKGARRTDAVKAGTIYDDLCARFPGRPRAKNGV